ncbi:MAG: hypothetical protein KTR30_27550 [Saprospiraceae bacterium]|nr:hypothetical protein [Saprospiraceae bacterium]
MRIIGYLEHPRLKVTVFKMDNKLSVKFETGMLEQTYKFRTQAGLEGLADLEKLVDTEFASKVEAQFAQMQKYSFDAYERLMPDEEEDEFDTII